MAAFSDYLENAILNYWLRANVGAYSAPGTVYLALFTADPTDTGSTTNEVTQATNSYARQAISFNAESGGAITNNGAVSFADMPGVTVTHWGLFDTGTYQSGNMLFSDALSGGSISPAAGDTVTLGDQQLTITLD